ncbi:lmo0937 family membrane protein [Candidatus Saccharibacteria bacterium]|nr:MAG: lmo0937 family membrane protein [Candidatus Saccharibacteria bacterium]TXG76089.1 MAG: lmo0937 family membrane protein [Patescibacteria group bacterium]
MLRIIAIALIVFWLLGLLGKIGGGLVHLLLVIALVVFIFDLVSGRRSV